MSNQLLWADPFRVFPFRWIGYGCAVAEAVRGRASEDMVDYFYGSSAIFMTSHVVVAGVAAAYRRESIVDATMKTMIFEVFSSFAVPLFVSYSVKRLTRRALHHSDAPKSLIKWGPSCAALATLAVAIGPLDSFLDMVINGKFRSIPVPRISPSRICKISSPLGAHGVAIDGFVHGTIKSLSGVAATRNASPTIGKDIYSPKLSDKYSRSPRCTEQPGGGDGRYSERYPRPCPPGCEDMSNVIHPDVIDESRHARNERRSPRKSARPNLRTPHPSRRSVVRGQGDKAAGDEGPRYDAMYGSDIGGNLFDVAAQQQQEQQKHCYDHPGGDPSGGLNASPDCVEVSHARRGSDSH